MNLAYMNLIASIMNLIVALVLIIISLKIGKALKNNTKLLEEKNKMDRKELGL